MSVKITRAAVQLGIIVLLLGFTLHMKGQSKLLEGAAAGDVTAVKLQLKKGAAINDTDARSHSALMLAAANGHPAVVKILLKAGAKPDMQNYFGETALMLAVSHNHTAVVKLLLKKKADSGITDKKGWNALMLSKSPATTALLLKHKAAGVGYAVPQSGITALMVAAEEGNLEIVRLLLAAGADKELANSHGLKAFDFALRSGHQLVADLLK
jgi:uncharacterized protein